MPHFENVTKAIAAPRLFFGLVGQAFAAGAE
jgi:hypothetical protein